MPAQRKRLIKGSFLLQFFLDKMKTIYCPITILQWNPDFLNPQFPESPDISNQTLFPLDLLDSSSIISPPFSQTLNFLKLPVTRANFGSRRTNWPLITGTCENFQITWCGCQLHSHLYHRFYWYTTLENKTPAEMFPKFPLVLRVIDRSVRNPPITAQ